MKKLLTISAVVFLMVFTAGLASAKTPVVSFPFTGTGDLFTMTDTGTAGGPISTTITVHEVSGLFWGTIVLATSPTATTIQFSAVRDVSGAFSFNGVVEGSTPPQAIQGGFVISQQKVPGLKTKVFAASIEYGALGLGESWAGVLFQ
jgi:hypothetical protein